MHLATTLKIDVRSRWEAWRQEAVQVVWVRDNSALEKGNGGDSGETESGRRFNWSYDCLISVIKEKEQMMTATRNLAETLALPLMNTTEQ